MAPQQRQMAEAFLQAGNPESDQGTNPPVQDAPIPNSENGLSEINSNSQRSVPLPRSVQAVLPQRTFVSRTYRLAPHIVGTLNAIARDRMQQRSYPYTREDIIHEALSDWFRQQGYMMG